MTTQRTAFTLVEILISLAIFLTLVGMIGNIFFRTSRITSQSLALLELFQKAESINKYLESDFLSLQQSCALHYDETARTLTFMTSLAHLPEQDGDYFTLEKWHGYDLVWTRWEWDPAQGTVHRGNTRTSENHNVQLLNNIHISNRHIHQNNRRAIPQRDFVYFTGRGNTLTGTSFNGAHASKQQIFEKLNAVSGNQINAYQADLRFRKENAHQNTRTLGVLGDTDAVNNVFAVRNPDGKTYNKDYANLLGESDDQYYPNQIAPLAENVEFFAFELMRRDGVTRLAASDDDDTIDDNATSNPSIDLKGIDLHTRNKAMQREKRPGFVNVYYLLHDMPNNVPGVSSDNLLQELRDRVIGSPALNDSDYFIDLKNRRDALYNQIELNGYNALIINKSVRLPH